MIVFNKPPFIGSEINYLKKAIENQKISGDGAFTEKCNKWIEENFRAPKALLTTSCTHALEMAALLIGIVPGDEVIMPSYTFVSTANAFVLRGAKIVFVDIRPDTMNLNEELIKAAITKKTKAIVPVHYAGVPCEMNQIMKIAREHGLYVIEDAAQGVMSRYNGKSLGTIGDIGCYSFHETKNYSMGEGGTILLNNENFIERAEVIREKGTNRSKFLMGQVDKYTWVDIGSSYLPSELNAAYLYAQLERADQINSNRLKSWHTYYQSLKNIEEAGLIDLPYIPSDCEHNAHMFYIKCKDIIDRTALSSYLAKRNISAVFHYIPLHSSDAGRRFGVFHGCDNFTTQESERLLRLPLYYGLNEIDIQQVVTGIQDFFKEKGA